jgi:serine/threonine-protein phosphatase 6 regulatory subunit 3
VETGRNRELAISLFRDAKIMHRIVEGQARNDNDTYVHSPTSFLFHFFLRALTATFLDLIYTYRALTKGGRLGYMGHLTLIAEDVITALEHFPPELRLLTIQYAPEDEWDRYVTGRYTETKANDTRLLGGGKPIVASRNVSQWKVDEDELASGGGGAGNGAGAGGAGAASSGVKSEFRRVGGAGGVEGTPRNTAHFLPESIEEEEEEDDDDDDDDDEDSTRAAHVGAKPPSGIIFTHCFYSLLGIWNKRCIPPLTSSIHQTTMMMTMMKGGFHNLLLDCGIHRCRRCIRVRREDRWVQVVLT